MSYTVAEHLILAPWQKGMPGLFIRCVPHDQKHAVSLQPQTPDIQGSAPHLGGLFFSHSSVKISHWSTTSLYSRLETQPSDSSCKSGVSALVCSLTFMIRMSSEVCQLCLEALTPLAEQCVKAQETDSPLFLATRHFLKVRRLGGYIIAHNSLKWGHTHLLSWPRR